jgi:glycerol-3-phosphate acyltransferase PlsX
MGANVNVKPKHLYAYGIMASAYSATVLGVESPKVGLLNVGEEEAKGSEVQREAYAMLKEAPINFVGNVEGGDIFSGELDVVVCDGFVGNVVLKASEAVAGAMADTLKTAIRRSWLASLGALLVKPAFRTLRKKVSYDEYGGAPLLGVDGIVIIGHGRSNPTAVKNALRVAHESVAHRLNEQIEETLHQANGHAAPAAAEPVEKSA